jgi:hypothetical protein
MSEGLHPRRFEILKVLARAEADGDWPPTEREIGKNRRLEECSNRPPSPRNIGSRAIYRAGGCSE